MNMLLNVAEAKQSMSCKIPILFISKENKVLKYRDENKRSSVALAMLEVTQYVFSDYTMEIATKINGTARIEICRPLGYNRRLRSKSVQPQSLMYF